MKTLLPLLLSLLASLAAIPAGAIHDEGFRITRDSDPQSGPETYGLSWTARQNGMYVLVGNLDLRSPWFPIARVPDFVNTDPPLAENEFVQLNAQTDADRFFYQLVRHEGVYISTRCEGGSGVILEMDASGWFFIKQNPYLNSCVIERATRPEGPFTPIAESTRWRLLDLLPIPSQFIDRHVSPNTQYWYRVKFTDDNNQASPPSNIASITTSCEPPTPFPLSAACAPGRIALEWDLPLWVMDDISSGDFVIMRSSSPEGPFARLNTARYFLQTYKNVLTFSDLTETGGPFYYYFFLEYEDKDFGFSMVSPPSEIASADPAACPDPEKPKLTVSCRENRIVLRWVRPAWATKELTIIDWFVERSTDPEGNYSLLATNYGSSQDGGIFYR